MQRVLVVDDSTECALPLKAVLAWCGFGVAVASDGAEALALLDGFVPDVVILDLHMPVMDGYGFLGAMRDLPQWAGVGVIVFTADYEADAARLGRLGVKKVCRKAYTSFRTLVEEVQRCLPPPAPPPAQN
jgi:CheY-like chemotaxis protein